jgi:hypothetical protein
MVIAQKYSHLNGEEFLLVHHKKLYQELIHIVESIDAEAHRTKISREKTMRGRKLLSPVKLNASFGSKFRAGGWHEERYTYVVTTDRELMQKLVPLSFSEQKRSMQELGVSDPLTSYKQTDFVKDQIAVEVQFGKYAFVAFDLFVKHLLFYSGGIINVGIEILPTKKMQSQMSSGIAYYEGEVYNVLRHGRSSPPVPLLILGVEP